MFAKFKSEAIGFIRYEYQTYWSEKKTGFVMISKKNCGLFFKILHSTQVKYISLAMSNLKQKYEMRKV